MEPIQICDPVNNRNFEVYVTSEVAERCRTDQSYAEDLYTQIQEQNVEDGSTIEIETEVVENLPIVDTTERSWNNRETLNLIELYQLYKNRLHGYPKNKVLWVVISEELAKRDIHRPPVKCSEKWKNLMKGYRLALQDPKKSRFMFFQQIDKIVKSQPAFIIDISDNEENLSETWDSEVVELETVEKELWSHYETLKFLRAFQKFKHLEKVSNRSQFWSLISEELAKENLNKAADKCANKWKNLLRTYRKHANGKSTGSFPYFEGMDKLINTQDENGDDSNFSDCKEMNFDTPNAKMDEDEQCPRRLIKWTEEETLKLIGAYKEHRSDKCDFKMEFWDTIAAELMCEGTFDRDGEECRDKWRSLVRAYERNLSENGRQTFQFAQAINEVFREELEAAGGGLDSHVFNQDIVNGADNLEHLTTEDDSNNWSKSNISTLVESCRKYKQELSSKNSKNDPSLWNQICEDLRTEGIHSSPESCQQYWNSLIDNFRDRKNFDSSNFRPSHCKMMEEILNNQDEEMEEVSVPEQKCLCSENLIEKRKRHFDRMELLKRKLDIEERKVKAFEEYLIHLKANPNEHKTETHFNVC